MTKCPKCNNDRNPSDIECPKCGVVYKKYEDYVAKNRIVTEKETTKQEISDTVQAEPLGAQPQNSDIDKNDDAIPPKNRIRKKKFVFVISFAILLALIGGYAFIRKSPETKARRAVDTHLNSIMTGKGNPYETVDITKVREIFINVLNYKYLNTLRTERVQDEPMVFNQKAYEDYYKKIYDSYEKFLQEMKRLYGDRATETEAGLIVKSEDYHYEFEFLYDVTITNRLGQQLFKKYVFEVKPSRISDSGYEITSFYER